MNAVQGWVRGGLSFNRTSLELKLMLTTPREFFAESFNRTSLELKLLQTLQVMPRRSLLIEPVWN